MNASLNFVLIIVLVASPMLILPNPKVNARNLVTHDTVFSIDLIHRNSLPSYSNSSIRLLGSLSHHQRVSLSPTYHSIKNIQTDIIPNGGDYLMKIAIGTPPVEFTAVADTGSDLVWVQCSPCQRCIDQQSPLFDPRESESYRAVLCSSQSCTQPGIKSGCQSSDACTYATQYGDGTKTEGVLNTETIRFPSSPGIFPSFVFGCGLNQQGVLGIDGDGIIGLGSGPLSLVSQLRPKINSKFSYCLTPQSLGRNSKLKFGLEVTGQEVVSTPYTNRARTSTFYYLTLDGITVEGNLIDMATDIIIDSGTTLTYLPSNVYENVKNVLKSAIRVNSVDDPNQVFDPCYETGPLGQDFSPPEVVMNFRGADVVLKTENLFRAVDSLTCLAMVPTDDIPIFGNIAQVNFEVGYDLQAKQVSFAPKDCTNY